MPNVAHCSFRLEGDPRCKVEVLRDLVSKAVKKPRWPSCILKELMREGLQTVIMHQDKVFLLS